MSEMHNLNGNANGTATSPSAAIEQTSTYADTIFARLDPREVEQFYKSYQLWSLQRRMQTLQIEVRAIQQAIIDNNSLMQPVAPSAIALASLAQLQASGVNDLDLLDRMLERGDIWLDHTMQLLEHCEKLDMIQGDYTQWCEHALEGAYDWIESMEATRVIQELEVNNEQQAHQHTATEEQLLQKLTSDEDATGKIAALHSLLDEARERTRSASVRKITQPLAQVESTPLDAPPSSRKITQPLDHQAEIPLPTRKITQPLDQDEALIETALPVEADTPVITEPSETALPVEANAAATTEPSEDEVSLQLETPLLPADIEDDPEQTTIMPALSIKWSSKGVTESNPPAMQVSEQPRVEHDEQIDTVKPFTETVQEVAPDEIEEAGNTGISEEAAETSSKAIIISSAENKKPQIQKVQRGGFWRLLNRLLAFILRRSQTS